MYVRTVLLIGTTVVGMLSASDAQAGLFGKRKCCQETPVVCPQACCPAPVASYSVTQIEGCAPAPACYGAQSFAPVAGDSVRSADAMTEIQNLNAAVTSARQALTAAESEITQLRTEISALSRVLATVDQKVTTGTADKARGVGKAVEEIINKTNP